MDDQNMDENAYPPTHYRNAVPFYLARLSHADLMVALIMNNKAKRLENGEYFKWLHHTLSREMWRRDDSPEFAEDQREVPSLNEPILEIGEQIKAVNGLASITYMNLTPTVAELFDKLFWSALSVLNAHVKLITEAKNGN